MRVNVRWNQAERDLIFGLVPEPTPVPWMGMWRQVMKVLPPDRRRSLKSSCTSTNLKHEYHEWRKQHPDFRPPSRLDVPVWAAMEASAPSQEKQDAPNHEPEIIVVEKVVKQEPDYGRIPTSTLARILLERLAPMDQFDTRFREMEAMIRAKKLAEQSHDIRLGPKPPEKRA